MNGISMFVLGYFPVNRCLKDSFLDLARLILIAFLLGLLMSCGEKSHSNRIQEEARNRILCKDEVNCGNLQKPNFDSKRHRLFKWNDHWFLIPSEYKYNSGIGFYWPTRRPAATNKPEGAPTDSLVYLLPRSYDIPPDLRGYRIIEQAKIEGRVLEYMNLRPDLDRIRYNYKNPATGHVSRSLVITAYVATDRTTPEGLPPVLNCERGTTNRNSAGAGGGFVWREGIYVEIIVRSGDVCEHWPDLYDEIVNILSQVKQI